MAGAGACSPDCIIPPRPCFVPSAVDSVPSQSIDIADRGDCLSVLVFRPWLGRAVAPDDMGPAEPGVGPVFRNRLLEECGIVEVPEVIERWHAAVCDQMEKRQEEDSDVSIGSI
jgi:hypothetical protein